MTRCVRRSVGWSVVRSVIISLRAGKFHQSTYFTTREMNCKVHNKKLCFRTLKAIRMGAGRSRLEVTPEQETCHTR